MEAQFGVLVFVIGSLLFTGKSEALPLVEGGVILLWWSLYWWAMLVKRGIKQRLGEERINLVYLPALPATFAIVVGIHPAFVENLPQLAFSIVLSLWFWRHGMVRVEKSTQGESILTIFQAGFVVLLGILLLANVYPQPTHGVLLDLLTYTLPFFCLSGFVALSLSYLSTINSTLIRRALKGSRANFRRTGLLLLFLLVAITASTIFLTIAAFQPLEVLFSPLINGLRALYTWLLSLLVSQPPPPETVLKRPPGSGISVYPRAQQPYANPLEAALRVILIVVALLLALFVLVALFWIIRRILQRKSSNDEDEVRERLAVRSILKIRQQKKQKNSSSMLEPLDATSARAHYREFLRVMASRGEDERGRRLDETPLEYQMRLLNYIEAAAHEQARKENTPDDATILGELTQMYMLERYGGKHSVQHQQAYLRKWVPLLSRRLRSNKPLKTPEPPF